MESPSSEDVVVEAKIDKSEASSSWLHDLVAASKLDLMFSLRRFLTQEVITSP